MFNDKSDIRPFLNEEQFKESTGRTVKCPNCGTNFIVLIECALRGKRVRCGLG